MLAILLSWIRNSVKEAVLGGVADAVQEFERDSHEDGKLSTFRVLAPEKEPAPVNGKRHKATA